MRVIRAPPFRFIRIFWGCPRFRFRLTPKAPPARRSGHQQCGNARHQLAYHPAPAPGLRSLE